MSEAVQQGAGESLRAEDLGPQPFQTGRLGDEYDVPRQLGRPRRREMLPIPPPP